MNSQFTARIAEESKIQNYSSLDEEDDYTINSTPVTLQVQESIVSVPEKEIEKDSQIVITQSSYDLARAAHPYACIATFIFKLITLFSYLFLNIFIDNKVLVYIIVIIFSAFDFWTVKNITGRLLVGLKWSSEYGPDGTEIWQFESSKNPANGIDATFFWTSQIGSILIWALFSILNFLSLNIYWTSLNGIALSLSFANFYGFYKCRGEHQKKMNAMKAKITEQTMGALGNFMIKNAFTNFLNKK